MALQIRRAVRHMRMVETMSEGCRHACALHDRDGRQIILYRQADDFLKLQYFKTIG